MTHYALALKGTKHRWREKVKPRLKWARKMMKMRTRKPK